MSGVFLHEPWGWGLAVCGALSEEPCGHSGALWGRGCPFPWVCAALGIGDPNPGSGLGPGPLSLWHPRGMLALHGQLGAAQVISKGRGWMAAPGITSNGTSLFMARATAGTDGWAVALGTGRNWIF